MKLLIFSKDHGSEKRLGAHVEDKTVVDVRHAYNKYFNGEAPNWFDSVNDLLNGGERALELAREVLQQVTKAGKVNQTRPLFYNLDEVIFHPPVSGPVKILCVTMNYSSHAQASLTKPSEDPFFFIKMPNLLTAHRSPVLNSKTSKKCDSEIELAVIIGKRGKYISREDAFDYVAGYTVFNDFSFRDRRTIKSDPNSARLNWLTLKNLDTAAPIGPWIVTKDEIPDPYNLEITLTLENDPRERQTGSTSGMMHKIPDLIYHASDGLTLEPGDIISTGTPHAVAFDHERFLKEGDILRAEIDKIGVLINPIKIEI